MKSIGVFKELSKRFEKNNFVLYLVGGSVRDYLLHRDFKDLDLATNANPEELANIVEEADKSFIKFGNVKMKIGEFDVAITCLRKETAYSDSRHPKQIEYIKDIKEDSFRRDFTCNAIYLDAHDKIFDFHQGRDDIRNKKLRMIGDAEVRIKEDPLRILRALRFESELEFTLDEELNESILRNLNLLSKLKIFKIEEELNKIHPLLKSKIYEKYHLDDYLPRTFRLSKIKAMDMHCDTITALAKYRCSLFQNDFHLDINKLLLGGYALQCFAIFVKLDQGNPYQKFINYYNYFIKEMEKNQGLIKQVFTYQDILSNISSNCLSAVLTVEEGGIIEGDMNKLLDLYQKGVRMMTLTWNFPNEIGYSNLKMNGKVPDSTNPETEKGLTSFGFEVVKKMNEIGMIVDVSHLSDKGFYDVIKTSTKPIVASHSNARAICNVTRNLSDDMIIKLKENRGIMGINYCPDFISNNKGDQMEDIVKHINHIVKVGGIDTVALGSDFDGIPTPIGMDSALKVKDLYLRLKREGYSERDLSKMFKDNFLRVFKANCN